MNKVLIILSMIMLFLISGVNQLCAQYPPAAGIAGSTALYKDSSVFIDWASGCSVARGYMDIAQPSLGWTTFGNDTDATGKAGVNGVVSLGDGGSAILTFNTPIANGQGYDFAIFENAFNDYFLELAYVEASSDGQNFVRFPAHSLTASNPQVGSFGQLDPTKLNNLAGKYRQNFGTPFDLAELTDSSNIDISHITHIKIIDVVGNIDYQFARYDAFGNIINDPYPTPYETGGFDLDAVGVINNTNNTGVFNLPKSKIATAYPNPASEFIKISSHKTIISVDIYNISGICVFSSLSPANSINIQNLNPGYYYIIARFGNNNEVIPFIKIQSE